MKVFIEHDQRGTIFSVGVALSKKSENVHFAMRARPGYQVTEVDAPHVKDENDHEHLVETKKHYRFRSDKFVRIT